MKLAEALQERADLNRAIDQLESRICDNVLVQQDERPAEDPNALFIRLDECTARLQTLTAQINHTNCQCTIDGIALTDLIAQKDMLKVRLNVYRNAIGAASQSTYRARGTEIKIVSTVDVGELRAKSDAMAKELRLLDNKLQQANWNFDLIEG